MTAALISFRFLRRGEIYDSFDLGHVMGFTNGSTYFLHHIAVHSGLGLDDARLGQPARSPHHGGRPLSLVCSISIGEGRYTIHARAILVIFAATTAHNSNIAVHSRPGLDDARFRATHTFPASWWTTALLGLF